MNPAAANYNPSATMPDGSCLFLKSIGGICYLFKEPIVERKDFTVSYSLIVDDWVFFHSYKPDAYLQTRNKLYCVKDNKIYRFNDGPHGVYFDTPESFFIDLVVSDKKESVLSALQWVTEVLDPDGKDREHLTFTHITIWNNYQCTGRLEVKTALREYEASARKSKGAWSFNDFRDLVKDNDQPFLGNLFQDFAVDTSKLDVNLPWYEKELLVDDHFIVRLEFDNQQDLQILLHQHGALMDKTY